MLATALNAFMAPLTHRRWPSFSCVLIRTTMRQIVVVAHTQVIRALETLESFGNFDWVLAGLVLSLRQAGAWFRGTLGALH